MVTSFGQRSQQMITKLFEGISGSTTKGIDIEFVDKIDGRKKYCQVKAGPNVINKDDVPTVKNHFRDAMNLARTNNLQLQNSDFMFCLLYGEDSQKNAFVKEIEKDYPVVIGENFWVRFTGDKNFYRELIEAIRSVAKESDSKLLIETVVKKLSKQIKVKYPDLV
ncbi:MAG: PmeII family type II restriction endonuclease [bacterium]|nr:PmeII family type II restriction endonuclease [bacterium]